MATKKPKTGKPKTQKKSDKPEKTAKTAKTTTTVVKAETVKNDGKKHVFKGFFAKKGDPNETVLTIFKSHKIWGALIGELVGTMLFTMLLLTLGIQPLYMVFAAVGIYIVIAGISGAQLNPVFTAGMMATRRISAIRGVLYILAQVIGAWAGLMIINAFRMGSGTETELPVMQAVTGDSFWMVTLVELMGAIMLGFFYNRAVKYQKKSPLTFALVVTSGITLAIIFGIVIAQSFFSATGNTFIFNPAAALMYQVLPSTADSFGQLMGNICLALGAYVVGPIIGGIAGFFLADSASRLSDEEA